MIRNKIFIIGDSTAAIKSGAEKPMSGWGEFLYHFVPDTYLIKNYAINGRSTKSFIDEKRLQQVDKEIGEDDILLIQFGHNDGKIEDPLRYTAPYKEYQDNLKIMIDVALKHKARPILLTSITRRRYAGEKIDPMSVEEYPNSMISLGNKMKIPVLDVHTATRKFLDSIGKEDSKKVYLHLEKEEYPNYPDGVVDDTHLSEFGASKIAEIIAELLKEVNLL